MTEQNHFEIVVVGSGPAGFTAAIYAVRGGAATALFGGVAPGGQLLQTMEIENYPGFVDPVVGADLMQKMLKQTQRLGAAVFQESITSADFSARPFRLKASSGKDYTADAVILATGAQAKWLGMPSEEKYKGKGVSGCATCDGFFFRGKEVAVIGGGDTAAEDALFLTKFATKVYLVHRRDALRANFRLQEKLRANPKVEIVYDHIPEEFAGETKLTAVMLKNVKTGAPRRLEVTGAFIAIGHTPATELVKGQLKLDEGGYIVTDDHTATSVPGVYAAGDVMDTRYKQAIVAAGAGCKAALEALAFIEG
ncbi:MAG: thioredoxin-disulfide reductase [Elusimicrobia bacterium GWA2_64_40]|nr:MAG: thioredoxin-disulfide reductase [Elusimicrobia bacterium GWA2_64_40]OGR63961.1 MAG: thioredoxin-disulfide reductase [Elusimicrobia bacterium GWB2_63_16]HAN04571.1 thioredoxin-disulfide reductase [Elusimicrobiota bacterium]